MQHQFWNATVGRTVALQWAVVLALSAAAWVWPGRAGALSLLAGGAAVAVPNALLALWLTLRMRRAGVVSAARLLAGEALKIGLTIGMLAAVARTWQPAVVWPALIVGVIAALKAQWLALWFTRGHAEGHSGVAS